jgi:hypothetical protein
VSLLVCAIHKVFVADGLGFGDLVYWLFLASIVTGKKDGYFIVVSSSAMHALFCCMALLIATRHFLDGWVLPCWPVLCFRDLFCAPPPCRCCVQFLMARRFTFEKGIILYFI